MSALEVELSRQIYLTGLPSPEREYRFHPKRRWRFDFAYPQWSLAVEVEGAVYRNGRHTRGAGFEADAEKYNTAALMGWQVLRVTAKHIKSGQALAWIEQALGVSNGSTGG